MSTIDELLAINPFPGLRAFAPSEADRFFGRRQQIEDLVARLDEVPFLAVAGSSGSGKSSLVIAGLLHALAEGRGGARRTEWRAAVMRPGNQPLANLAEKLAPWLGGGDGSGVGALYGRLGLGGLGLVEAVSLAHLPATTRVLVVVDQFEEIFRFQRMTDPDEASAFVKLLLNAAREPRSPVSVIITLRSEFLGSCADFRDLPETINRGQYLVPKLTREQRKEAIVNPVELRGFTIAPRAVQRLLNDVSDDFDDLPVMQHVLTRMWHTWANACQGSRPLDLEDYQAVGTAKHALSNHADEAYESLPALKPVTEKVFRALTERLAEGAGVRRPLEFDRLCEVVGADRGLVAQVVERFRRPDTAFLRPQEVPLAENPVIDISHESLIRLWQRLRQWAELESESRAMLLRLVEGARRYDAKQGSLWRGPELTKALEWRQRTKPTPAWVELYAPGNGADLWESAERFLAESSEEVRRERWRGKLQIAGVAGLVLALIAGVFAFNLSRRARSGELASRALEQLDLQPAVSARLALAAAELNRDNDRAAYALRQSLANLQIANREKVLNLKERVLDARYSRDGTRLVTASGKTVTIFDTTTFEPAGAPITRETDVVNAWLIANNTTVVTKTVDGQAQLQAIGSPTVRTISCAGEKNIVYTVGISAEETHVAAGCYNGDIRVWDVANPGAPPQEFSHGTKAPVTITALAFSTGEKYLASGDANGAVAIWKIGGRGGRVFGADNSPITHSGGQVVTVVAFHPTDANLLLTAAGTSAIVWRVDFEHGRIEIDKDKKPQRWELKHERPVLLARFFPGGGDDEPLFTVSDKVVRLWVNATVDPTQVRAHDDWVTDANVSADGALLVTASNDATARIWSTQSGAPVATLGGHHDSLTRAVISPDGTQVSTASLDGMVHVWRVRPPRLLFAAPHWMLSAAFAPGGSRVALGEEGGGSVLELNDRGSDSAAARAALEAIPADQINAVSWSRDMKLLVAVRGFYDGRDSQPALWDAETRKQIAPQWPEDPQGSGFSITSAVFNPAADELVTVHAGRIDVWDALKLRAHGELRPAASASGGAYAIVEVSPDGRWIAATHLYDNSIALWKRGELQNAPRLLEGHNGTVKSLQFSRDSKWLVTASTDRTSVIWPVDSSAPPKILRGGHTAGLAWASFNPDGTRVATASADSTIRVWDTGTLEELAVLRWHREAVNAVSFSPDGNRILSASDDGTVKLGQCEPCGLTLDQLRDRVGQLANLSEDERREVGREIDATRYVRLPAFLSRRP